MPIHVRMSPATEAILKDTRAALRHGISITCKGQRLQGRITETREVDFPDSTLYLFTSIGWIGHRRMHAVCFDRTGAHSATGRNSGWRVLVKDDGHVDLLTEDVEIEVFQI